MSHDHNRLRAATSGDTPPSESKRLGYALLLTLSVCGAEIAGGLLSGSLALLSDAGHMFVDSAALLMSYAAIKLSARPSDSRFTYGLRRVEILAALLNGATLLLMCGFIIYEAALRFLHPREPEVGIMLAFAIVGIGANLASALLLRHAWSLNARSAFLHVLGDLFSSGAVVAGGVIMLCVSVPWLDPALSIAISVVVLTSALKLTREAVGVLLEATPRHINTDEIRSEFLGFPFINDVHDLHVWTIASGLCALSCHVVIEDSAPASEEILQSLTSALRGRHGIEHATIQLESRSYNSREGSCFSC